MTARRMGLQHIEAFRAVVQTGSMTEAARRLNTSQPQISRLIAQLEQITKFPLFDRSGSRVFPTNEGTRFFQEVEKAFTGLSSLEAAAHGIRSFRADRLRVTAMPRLAGGLLTRIAARFMVDYPEVMVSIRSGTATTVHEWISSGLCDMGLAMLYQETHGVEVEPLYTGHCVAVLPKGHVLAARKMLTPRDLAGHAFIASPGGGQLAERIDQVFTAAGVRRRIVAETDLGASVCTLVGAGLGVSLVNPLAAHEEREAAGLEIRPFTPDIPTTVALIYPPYVARTRLVAEFSAYAKQQVQAELAAMEQVMPRSSATV